MMSDPTYNQQTITQYLLGVLPEAEIERLDELSISNDEFADSLRVAEKDLVAAYVQGELGGADLENFKSHYLASPFRREQVAFARSFPVFGAQEAVSIRTTPARTAATKRTWFAALSALISPRPILQW